jgi:hypothetical protein
MTDIPAEAIQAAAEVICDWVCGTDPETCSGMGGHIQLAEGALAKTEAAWPHDPPQRDPASTTAAVTERAPADRWSRAHRFGFGAPVRAEAYVGGATVDEDVRDERWRDAQS